MRGSGYLDGVETQCQPTALMQLQERDNKEAVHRSTATSSVHYNRSRSVLQPPPLRNAATAILN